MGQLKIKQTTWDLKPLFESDDDLKMEKKRKELEQKSYEFINKWKERDDYLKEPAVLKQALDEYEKWERYFSSDGDEGYYFWLRTRQDENDAKLKAKFNKVRDFGNKIGNDIRFFELRIAKIPSELQRLFLEYEGLKEYRHFLERLFAKSKYQLSEPEEKIMNLKAATSYSNWVKMTSGFLAKEERKILLEDGNKGMKTFSEIMSFLDNQNKKVRDSAAEALNDILHKYVEVAEAEMNSILANKKVSDELRGVSRPDLSRHVSDDIESNVIDILVGSVSDRFDVAKRYYEFKAKLMGVKKLEYYERNVTYGKLNKKYNFEEAINLIYRVFNNLDKKFSDILVKFINDGQIDVYPRKGKGRGAFCSFNLLSQPVYILLNHTDKLNDVLTLAHELGHGINDELIREKQNALNSDNSLSTAEVASTFMEDFILEEILKEADDELRLALMMMKLNENVSTIFRQVACYKFEQALHQEFRDKGYLSKEDIGGLFQKHMVAYMGDSVLQSSGSENWWVYWSHIRNFFYVYSYASGLLISKSLQNSVKQDHVFIEKVKEFLSAGKSDSPKNIFQKLGVDITKKEFWNKGLNEVEALLQETTTLAKKLGKIG